MTALTKDRLTSEREGRQVTDPLAAGATVYAGSMYVLDASGNAAGALAVTGAEPSSPSQGASMLSSAVRDSAWLSTLSAARLITCSSSRTLPGQA